MKQSSYTFQRGNNELVLMKDIEEQGDDETVVVNAELAKNLKYHQREGVKFMWNSCFKSSTPNRCCASALHGLKEKLASGYTLPYYSPER